MRRSEKRPSPSPSPGQCPAWVALSEADRRPVAVGERVWDRVGVGAVDAEAVPVWDGLPDSVQVRVATVLRVAVNVGLWVRVAVRVGAAVGRGPPLAALTPLLGLMCGTVVVGYYRPRGSPQMVQSKFTRQPLSGLAISCSVDGALKERQFVGIFTPSRLYPTSSRIPQDAVVQDCSQVWSCLLWGWAMALGVGVGVRVGVGLAESVSASVFTRVLLLDRVNVAEDVAECEQDSVWVVVDVQVTAREAVGLMLAVGVGLRLSVQCQGAMIGMAGLVCRVVGDSVYRIKQPRIKRTSHSQKKKGCVKCLVVFHPSSQMNLRASAYTRVQGHTHPQTCGSLCMHKRTQVCTCVRICRGGACVCVTSHTW